MKQNKCLNCREYQNCQDSFSSWIFFIIGIIATVSVRVVIVLIHLNPIYAKIAWYIGVAGFFAFFVYKFRISQARYKLIKQNKLMAKISQQQLSKDDYGLISALLCSLSSNKERLNYVFIFVLSALALALAVYMDFIR